MDDFSGDLHPAMILFAGSMAARNHRGLEARVLIRVLRRGAGLSQTELGERAGLQQSRVSEIESGRVEPRWSEIRRLLEAMSCEPVLLAASRSYHEKPPKGDWDE